MLAWARHPDHVFHEIVGDALDLTHALLEDWNPARHETPRLGRDPRREQVAPRREHVDPRREQVEWFSTTMPRSAPLFTAEEMLSLLRRLADAHRDEAALYRCTDYHWLVLYESLAIFIEIHNDIASDERARVAPVGRYKIGRIDFDEIVDAFFHDTDFLLDVLAAAPESLRRQLGVSRETWGLVAGLKPHPEEIALTPRGDLGTPPFLPGRGPRTRRLPAYPPTQLSVRTEWYFGEGAAAESRAITTRQRRRR